MRVSKSLRWRADGPLSQKYSGAIQAEFFASRFDAADEHQDFLTGPLSKESFCIIKRKIDAIFREFDELSDLDAHAAEANRDVFWLYCGIRPWAPVNVMKRVTSSVRSN